VTFIGSDCPHLPPSEWEKGVTHTAQGNAYICPGKCGSYCTVLYCTCYVYCTLLYSTLLYSTLLYSTLLYSTLLYSTLLYSTLLFTILLFHILTYSLTHFLTNFFFPHSFLHALSSQLFPTLFSLFYDNHKYCINMFSIRWRLRAISCTCKHFE
jgi:hypothetical protein